VRNRFAAAISGLTVLIALTAFPTAALAHARIEPTGDRINLFGESPIEIPPGEPFYVRHGWAINPKTDPSLTRLTFQLRVDGTRLRPDDVTVRVRPRDERDDPDESLEVLYLFNFEEGLDEGIHDLEGSWYAPCWYAEREGMISYDCGAGLARFRPVVALELHVEVVVGDTIPLSASAPPGQVTNTLP
jgi:hypothetical protein